MIGSKSCQVLTGVLGFEQKGLEGETLNLYSFQGSSSVNWAGGSSLTIKYPLTWYKVRTIQLIPFPILFKNMQTFFKEILT